MMSGGSPEVRFSFLPGCLIMLPARNRIISTRFHVKQHVYETRQRPFNHATLYRAMLCYYKP